MKNLNDFNVHQLFVHELANDIKFQIVKSIVKDLINIRGSSNKLSGADIYLENVWEEFCVDQQQGTNFREIYTEIIDTKIQAHLINLSHQDKCILYLEMNESEELLAELEEKANPSIMISSQIEFDEVLIIQMLRSFIDEAALNFTNANIERAINRDEVVLQNIESMNTKGSTLKTIPEPLDLGQMVYRRKINHIDKLQGRTMLYPELELNAPHFSYNSPEEMAILGKKHEYENSFRFKFRQSLHGIVTRLVKIGLYFLFTAASAAVTSLAYYWFVVLSPWKSWTEFYVWGPILVIGALSCFLVGMISPSKRYGKVITITFSLINLTYWLFKLWSAEYSVDHYIDFLVATLMICFLAIATILPLTSKNR